MNITQIFITDEPNQEMPPHLQLAINSIKSIIPHDHHKIWSKGELREWIANSYNQEVLKVFDKLRPYAYKADFARYLLVYKIGGWYFDISIRAINSVWIPDDIDFVAFSASPRHCGYIHGVSNALFYSRSYCEILKSTILKICENVRNEFYGINSLHPTGPLCLGQMVSKYSECLSVVAGISCDLTPGFHNQNGALILTDGTILALLKPGNVGGDLSYLGAQGTNNYNAFYNSRSVYDQSIEIDLSKIYPEEWSNV